MKENPSQPIVNCTVQFEFQCPRQWKKLEPTGSGDIRYCTVCSKNVYFCHTIDQVQKNALLGNCIAVDGPTPDRKAPKQDVPERRRRPTLGVPISEWPDSP